MLQIDLGTIYRSEERRLKTGTTGVVEGQALVADYENGELVVTPAGGALSATSKFAGVAISSVNPIKSMTKVEVLTTPAAGDKVVTLANSPSASTLKVYEGTTMSGTEQTYHASTIGANIYLISDKTVTLNKSATTYTFVYRYVPTVLEALNIQGEPEPGTHVSDVTETIGVITAGEVFTSEWLTTVVWKGTSGLGTTTNGRFTVNDTVGVTQISNAIVTKVPDTETGLLGFRFIT